MSKTSRQEIPENVKFFWENFREKIMQENQREWGSIGVLLDMVSHRWNRKISHVYKTKKSTKNCSLKNVESLLSRSWTIGWPPTHPKNARIGKRLKKNTQSSVHFLFSPLSRSNHAAKRLPPCPCLCTWRLRPGGEGMATYTVFGRMTSSCITTRSTSFPSDI